MNYNHVEWTNTHVSFTVSRFMSQRLANPSRLSGRYPELLNIEGVDYSIVVFFDRTLGYQLWAVPHTGVIESKRYTAEGRTYRIARSRLIERVRVDLNSPVD